MSLFEYKVRNADGQLLTGTLEASNDEDAAVELMEAGLTPVVITAISAEAVSFDLSRLREFMKPGVDLDALIVFSRQMHSLSKAGIPMIRALNGLADSTVHVTLSETIRDLVRLLESGRSLANAMRDHRKVFSDIFVAIIHVGENSGRLDESF